MSAVIEQINSGGYAFVEFAASMLIQASVLIVLLFLADLVLRRRVRAVFRYWMWLLVLVKLVLPTSLSGPFSIGYWFGDKLEYADVGRGAYEPRASGPMMPALPYIDISNVPPAIYPPVTSAAPGEADPASMQPIAAPAVPPVQIEWQGVVFLLWLAVVMAMALLLAQRAVFVHGLVAQAREASRPMYDALEECRRNMKVRGKVGLKVSPNAASPAVCGLLRPAILVPQDLATALDTTGLRIVLLHELAHVKRGDLWVNLAQTLLQIVYFYNPLLWLANAVIRRAREQAVDEAVLVAMGEGASRYPQTLVSVAKLAFKRPALSLRLIGVVESKKALTSRIKHILNRPMPKSAKLGVLGLLTIIVAAAILLPMARAEKNQNLLRGIDEKLKVTDKAGELTINSLYMPSPNGKSFMGTNKVTMYVDVTNNSEKDLYLGLEYYTDSGHITKVFSPGASRLAQIRGVPANWQGKLEYPIRYNRFAKGGYVRITLARCTGKQNIEEKTLAFLPPEVEIIYEKKYNIVPIDGTQADARALTDSSFTATLANGVTVELVGICEHPSEGKQWWGVGGQLVPEPYQRLNYNERSADSKLYEVAYRLFGCDDILSTIYSNSEIAGHISLYPLSQKTEKLNIPDAANAYGAILLVKPDAQSIQLEMGIGRDSDWKTLCTQASPVDKTGTGGPGVVFQPAIEKDGKTHITIAHQIKDGQIRVIAVHHSGQIHKSEGFLNTISVSGELGSCQVRFNLPADQIKEIQFQTQRFQRVTFENIALRPGAKTDVEIKVESEEISGVVGVKDSTLGKNTSAEAAFIIQKVLDRYAAIKTYSAVGELLTDVNHPPGGMGAIPGMTTEMLQRMGEQQLKSIFTIKMARPNLYCIEWNQHIDSDLSKVGNAWSVGDGSYGLILGKEKSFEKPLEALIWTASNMGKVQSSLFFDTSLNTLRELRDLSQQEDEQLEGVDCYVISGSRYRRTYTYWISKKDFLIRRYKFVSGGDGKLIEGSGHELTDETIKRSLKAMDKEATPEEIAKTRAMLTAANAMASEVKVTNTETYRNIILDQPISKEQFVPSKDIDEITEELKNLRAQYIHRLENISPTEPNLKTDVQVEVESGKLSTVTYLPNNQEEPQRKTDEVTYEGRTIAEWISRFESESHDEQREAIGALARIGRPLVPAMIEEMKKGGIRASCARGVLGEMGSEAEEAVPWLIEVALDKDVPIDNGWESKAAYRECAVSCLNDMPWARDRVVPVLRRIAEDDEDDTRLRRVAMLFLRDIGKEAIPILRKVTETEEDEIRDAAHHMLAQVLQREQGLSKDDYYTPLIEKDPFGASIPEYLAVMKSPKSPRGLGGLHPLTQKIKKLYRERLAHQPDPELAWRLATIIQNGLRNTDLEWAAPTGWSTVRWPREDPTENYTTLAEVLQLGFDHAESGSQLQRQFGISLAKLRLLQGDWDRMNAMLKELGQKPIPKESRQWLPAPPMDWEEGLGSQWKMADESMRSGNCSLEFRIEKGGKGLKGVHFLVKKAPESTNVIYTGISIDTLFFEPYPLKGFSSFGYKAADRPMTRYAVSDESGIVRFEKLPNIPIKIEVLVPTSNFPEAVSNWDLWMEVEPGKYKIAKKYGPGAINTQVPPAVAELKEGQTVHYPNLVVQVEVTDKELGQSNVIPLESVELGAVAEPTAPEPNQNRGRIRGVVVSAQSDKPIEGAYVGVGDFGDSGGSNYARHRSQGFFAKAQTDAAGQLFGLCGIFRQGFVGSCIRG